MPSDPRPAVVALNYHRIGPVDPANPFHRLHTVATGVFERQIEVLQATGAIVSLAQLDNVDELGPLNFAVSFDDVPIDALAGIDTLDRAGLPHTVAVCTGLADDGHGTRDKVYFITSTLTDQEIHTFLRPQLGDLLPTVDEFSFYYFSKSAVLPHNEMEQRVIEPLLHQVGYSLAGTAGRGYLDWDQLRDIAARPGATIVNHGHSHANLAALSRVEVTADVDLSHRRITAEIGSPPDYFAVPFGHIDQRVCLDLLDALHPHVYKGILWVGTTSNAIAAQAPPTMRHIVRIQAPDDVAGIHELLDRCLEPSNRRSYLTQQIRREDHRRPVEVIDGDHLAEVRSLEQILRERRPYATDDTYFDHQFIDNPHRAGRQAFQIVTEHGRPEAVLYNFHTTFRIDGQTIPGVYLSGWRRLPVAHRYASGLLLRRVVDREPIVGVYQPNPAVEDAFAEWHRAEFTILRIDPASVAALDTGIDVDVATEFPTALDHLIDTWSASAHFSVHRSGDLYRWRYDRYPLATTSHVVVRQHGHPVAHGTIVHTSKEWSISDYLEAPGSGASVQLVQAVCNLAANDPQGVDQVVVHISDQALTRELQQLGATQSGVGRSYYHFNPAALAAHGCAVDVDGDLWPSLSLHETELCGDVLPRPA